MTKGISEGEVRGWFFVSRVRILEIEANSQLPPLKECRHPAPYEAPLVHLSVLSSSFLRFAGYFDVPNLIEGIRRYGSILTSSLLIAVLFGVAVGRIGCHAMQFLLLSRALSVPVSLTPSVIEIDHRCLW